MNVKQVIVVRKDLNMPAGKLAAQVAHASVGAFIKSASYSTNVISLWESDGCTKIVLEIEDLEALLALAHKADNFLHECTDLIVDEGRTCFDGVHTVTCLGIGPYYSDDINFLTGHLKTYR